MLPVVDTHQHLWDLSKFRLPWLEEGYPLTKSYVMEDYLRETAGLNVVKTIYMEVDVVPEQHVAEAEYVMDLCERDDNPMVGAVIGGRPASAEFGAYLDRFRDRPSIKGVRQVLHGGTPRGYCLTPEFVAGVRLLGERGLRFDICLPPEELADGAKLAALCPETAFVLDHCGNAPVYTDDRSQWARDIAEVAKQGNVVCKISGVIAQAKPGEWKPDDLAPIVTHCAEVFGPDRVIFASDWPVCTLAATFQEWLEALQTIVADWPEADRRKLFAENAVRFYQLT
jgi:L-fuconolactonase